LRAPCPLSLRRSGSCRTSSMSCSLCNLKPPASPGGSRGFPFLVPVRLSSLMTLIFLLRAREMSISILAEDFAGSLNCSPRSLSASGRGTGRSAIRPSVPLVPRERGRGHRAPRVTTRRRFPQYYPGDRHRDIRRVQCIQHSDVFLRNCIQHSRCYHVIGPRFDFLDAHIHFAQHGHVDQQQLRRLAGDLLELRRYHSHQHHAPPDTRGPHREKKKIVGAATTRHIRSVDPTGNSTVERVGRQSSDADLCHEQIPSEGLRGKDLGI